MAAQKLGGAVQHEVRAQRQRILVDGRGEGVIDDDRRPGPVSRAGEAVQVHDFQRGIGGRFQVKHAAAFGDLRFDGVVIGGVAQADLDLEARQEFGKQDVGAAVGILHRDDAIAR